MTFRKLPLLNSLVFIPLFFLFISFSVSEVGAATYYVNPDSQYGNDSNSGAIDYPWLTLGASLPKLSAGDTLNLRGGTYFETGLSTTLSGSSGSHITIQAYQSEVPVVDGGLSDVFRYQPGRDDWDNISGDKYRSKKTFCSSGCDYTYDGSDHIIAHLINANAYLLEYTQSQSNFTHSTSDESLADGGTGTNYYFGPGLWYDSGTHKILMRLPLNTHDDTDYNSNSISWVNTDPDNSANDISIFTTSNPILTLNHSTYLDFKNITFTNAWTAIKLSTDQTGSPSHLTFDGITFNTIYNGIATPSNGSTIVDSLEVTNSVFNGDLPQFVHWTDVKAQGSNPQDPAEAEPEFTSTGITGAFTNSSFTNNTFENLFDGMTINPKSESTLINDNTYKEILDDSMTIDKCVDDVEVDNNLFWHINNGISINRESDDCSGQGSIYGDVFAHHNVIDSSWWHRNGRPGNAGASIHPEWSGGNLGVGHGSSGDTMGKFKFYNNTITTRNDGDATSAGPEAIAASQYKFFENNIVYTLDDNIIYSNETNSSPDPIFDYNVLWQETPAATPIFFSSFCDGYDYESLSDFLGNTSGDCTSWELHSLQADPGFVINDLDNQTLDSTIWNRYMPNTSSVANFAVASLSSSWPDYNSNYVGALAYPTVTLTSSASILTHSVIPMTATFSRAVTGFTTGDITVTNGSVSNLSGSGTSYTFDVTASSSGTVTISLPSAVVVHTDSSGRNIYNTPSNIFSIIYANNDLAVTTVTCSPCTANAGTAIQISVTVQNVGNVTDSNIITQIKEGSTQIGTDRTISSLTSDNSSTKNWSWDTTGVSSGAHTITGLHTYSEDYNPNNSKDVVITIN